MEIWRIMIHVSTQTSYYQSFLVSTKTREDALSKAHLFIINQNGDIPYEIEEIEPVKNELDIQGIDFYDGIWASGRVFYDPEELS